MRFATVCSTILLCAFAARAGDTVDIDGLKSSVPDSWKKGMPTNSMQHAVFTLPKADGDPEDGTLTVYFFGPNGGGTADANIKRWKDMFKAPAGEKAKVEKFKVGDVDVTSIDLGGTFLYRTRPGDPNVTEKPDFRRPGVIFASKKGPYYFRFVGPAKTIEKYKAEFDQWVKNFK